MGSFLILAHVFDQRVYNNNISNVISQVELEDGRVNKNLVEPSEIEKLFWIHFRIKKNNNLI